jgi:hypothetical protein
MRKLSKKSQTLIVAVVLAAALAAGLFVAFRSGSRQSNRNLYENMRGWQQISGRWAEHAGIFSNSNYGHGDMLIAQGSQGSNYRIAADIRFDLLFPDTHYGDAGLVIRTTDPGQGVDSYQGYYAGGAARPADGRPRSRVLRLASVEDRGAGHPISVGSWYHLELSAQGCALTVTVSPMGSDPISRIDYQDPNCLPKAWRDSVRSMCRHRGVT